MNENSGSDTESETLNDLQPMSAAAEVETGDSEDRIQQLYLSSLHAHICQRRGSEELRDEWQCTSAVSSCKTMKSLLNHMTSCQKLQNCMVPYCSSSRELINHWNDCVRIVCSICLPLRQADERSTSPFHWEFALHLAATNNNIEWGQLLMIKGMDVNARNPCNQTPLHVAVMYDNLEFGRLLIENGADIATNSDYIGTPLHLAAQDGGGMNKLQFENLAGVRAKGNKETYPFRKLLHSFEFGRLLIEKGADVNAKTNSNQTALHYAAIYGNIEVGRLLLENGVDVNWKDTSETTPLHFTAHKGDMEFGRLLLENGADINAKTNEGETPLYFAILNKKFEFGRLLIENGADINAKDKYKRTPLHLAASDKNSEFTWLLIENGADINAETMANETVLHSAAKGGDIELGRLLLKNGADVHAKSERNQTALHHAAWYGNIEVGRLLLENGADVNAKTNDGKTPLYCATFNNEYEFGRLLIESGADINAKDKYKQTPLHLAASDKNSEFAWLLIENGADINAKTTSDETVLHCAAMSGDIELGRLLLENGADVTAELPWKGTPIFVAARCENIEFVRLLIEYVGDVNSLLQFAASTGNIELGQLLLENGADFRASTISRQTPIFVAAENNNLEFIRLLIEYGENVNIKNYNGETLLHFAANTKNIELGQLVLEHGASVDARDNTGKTPLHCIVSKSYNDSTAEFFCMLLYYNASVNEADDLGYVPYISAIYSINLEIADMLYIYVDELDYIFVLLTLKVMMHLFIFNDSIPDYYLAHLNKAKIDEGTDEQLLKDINQIGFGPIYTWFTHCHNSIKWVWLLLSKGFPVTLEDIQVFYETKGFCEEIEAILSSEVPIRYDNYCGSYIKKLIYNRIDNYDYYFTTNNYFAKKGHVPSLVQIARDRCRKDIFNEHQTGANYKAYNVIMRMEIPKLIKDILLLKHPIYIVN
nr:uncharacterized protein LOC111418452 [Onthophagus taurus]